MSRQEVLEVKVNSHVWCQLRWPRGLRSGSAAVRLLGLRVRNLSVAWIFVSYKYCMCCQEEDSVTGRSLVRRSLTECGVSEYDLETSTMRRSRPTRAVEPWKKSCLLSSYQFLKLINVSSKGRNQAKLSENVC